MLNVSLRAISRPALCRLWQSAHIKRVRQLGSIAFGPNEPALLNQTIPEHFAGVVSQYGDRTAVISSQQRIRLTYSQLDTDSTKLASGLAKQGIRKGDRVAVSLGNNIEFATLTYALWKLGAILVPLNPGFNAAQIISALSHLSASALIIGAETNLPYRQPRDNRGLLEQVTGGPIAQAIQSEKIPSLRRVILVDNTEGRYRESKALLYSQVYEDGAALSQEKLDADDIINIQFTSGTTSSPKAVCLTHTSILNNGNSIGDRMTLTHEDIICCPPPLFHCFGSVLGYMASATHGSAIVFPSEAFDPLAVLRAVDEESATALYGVPTMFLSELELLSTKAYVPKAWVGGVKGPAFPSLRTGIGAGSSQPIELMRRLHRDLNLTGLTICYGMTETSPVSLQTTTEDSLERRVATVGAPLPHVGVKVVDASDRNRVLPYGEKGELAVSGYLLMKGYWEDPEKTAEVMQEEEEGRMWIYTGDEACMDKEGYVQITGRIKDLIIRGGENIHPLEVENCLLAHPSVRDVSVVGVPDDRYGESVGAFIVLNQSAEQDIKSLQAHVRDHLSNHLAPKHVWFIDQLPKTESGKIKKYELRKLAEGYVRD